MKNTFLTLLILAVCTVYAFAQSAGTITESLNLPQNSSQYTIKVMNLNGKVDIQGHSGTAVEMKASKTVEARRNADQLEQEWKLVFRQEGNTVLVYADGPGVTVKQNSSGNWSYSVNNDSKDGMVKFDIELRVPDAAVVQASTINAGDVSMQNLQSDAEATNVNGAVRLTNMNGNVKATTVNGDVEVQSKKAPSIDTKFTTVNGAVRLTYPPQLAANIQYTSVSGDFYTDFDVTASPLKEEKRNGGGTYYKVGGKSALQVGQGGPKIKITTVNGDMFLKKGDN
ncbi:DUF4097 family beta strand repeat-containing protein [Cesiribacter sp. SM1]|uniref:DUF4097 family beta strand repeat-containing protein n=1 Tax=Cesiribacter sp. SM1 TaxID=2861196 RepID=UPI001CD2F38C|nr:DUF4097 family beta strand repeat-containing protein [Cesiribacter sp. SM1]